MDKILTVIKALSDRNRLRIVMALAEFEELCACQVTELLQVAGATASRHLALLVNAGLLESRKDGRWVYYRLSLADRDVPVLHWLRSELKESADLIADRQALGEIVACGPEEICRRQRGEACCPKK